MQQGCLYFVGGFIEFVRGFTQFVHQFNTARHPALDFGLYKVEHVDGVNDLSECFVVENFLNSLTETGEGSHW